MKTKAEYPPTPELNKMKAVTDKSQVIGEFLEWLQSEKGVRFGKPHVHAEGCHGWDEGRGRYNPRGDDRCSFETDEFEPINFTIEKILAEFFKIDLRKVENERRAILELLRQ